MTDLKLRTDDKMVRIFLTEEPEEREAEALRGLQECANVFDGTNYGMPDDADLYLFLYRGDMLLAYLAAYVMGETCHGRQITEISACTKPEERGKGFFRMLLEALSEEPEGNAVLRFAVYEIPVTLAVLSGLGAVRDHAELMMRLPLSCELPLKSAAGCLIEAADTEDGTEAYYCHSLYSECRVRLSGSRAYIYGVLTGVEHRRGHHAEALLREVLAWLRTKKCREAFLEVSDMNEAAAALYRKLGFSVSDRVCYYMLDGRI